MTKQHLKMAAEVAELVELVPINDDVRYLTDAFSEWIESF